MSDSIKNKKMRNIHFFLYAVLIVLLTFIFVEVTFFKVNTVPEALNIEILIQAIFITIEWFIILFTTIVTIIAIPIIIGDKKIVDTLTRSSMAPVLKSIVKSIFLLYRIAWIFWVIPIVDVLIGLHLTYSLSIRGITFFSSYTLSTFQWGLYFLISIIGLIGIKATIMLSRYYKIH